MVSHVAQQVAARIAAARQKDAEDKRRRQELAEARQHGLAARHAQKLNRQANHLINERRPPMQTQTSAEQATPSDRHQPAALLITTDGRTLPITLPDTPEDRLTVMKAVLCCHDVEAADLSNQQTMWVDETGGMYGQHRRTLNVVASALADRHGVTGGIRGPALITGTSDKGTVALTAEDVAAIEAAVTELVAVEWVEPS